MGTVKTDGSLLLFTRGVHCSAKYEFKRSHFFLMSDTNLSLLQIGGMQRAFLPLKGI